MRKLRRFIRQALGRSGLRRLLAGLALAGCSMLTTLAAAAEHGGHGGHGELQVNWWTWDAHAPPVGWFIVDFVIFVALLIYFARKPIRDAFAQRHQKIKKAIAEATEAHDRASGRYQEYQDKLANVETEATQHVNRGREDGALERDQIIGSAKDYAGRLRTDSKSVIDQEYTKATFRLRRELVQDVLRLTEETLRAQLTDADRNQLVEEAIAELENGQAVSPKARPRKGEARPRAGGAP